MRLSLALCLLCAGCMVGPKYEPPSIVASDEWVISTLETEINAAWWTIFEDPQLNETIDKAIAFNRDVLAAEANVLQAIALRQVAASALFPQLSGDFNATKTYFSKNGPVFAIGPATGSLPGTVSSVTGLPFSLQIPQIQNLYNLLLNVSWEIDLFGKTRHAIEASKAAIGKAIENRNGILLSVMGEVAHNYLQLRANQQLALLLEQNTELLSQILAILRESLQRGYINKLDYEQGQATLTTEKAKIPPLIAACYKNIYALSVLTGEPPEALIQTLMPVKKMPPIPKEIAVGLRSDILRRRPDVRFAERNLAESVANVGVAVASFFPTITLFADAGLQSLRLDNLFNMKSKTWAYGGDASVPLYTGGQLFGNLHASQAAGTQAAHRYEQTVLTALKEAETFLMSYHEDLKTVDNVRKTAETEGRLLFLKRQQYEHGLINYIQYLQMQREYNNAEQSVVQAEATTYSDVISLFKALGGGPFPTSDFR